MTGTVLNDSDINGERDRHGFCLQLTGVGWDGHGNQIMAHILCDHYYDGKKTNMGNRPYRHCT